jgi:hypothetical protein
MASGYAVLVDGKIDLRTVSDTERAAKVNGLLVLYQIMTLRDTPDAQIASAWDARPEPTRADVIPVWVQAMAN